MHSVLSYANELVNWIAEDYSAPFLGTAAIVFLAIHIYSSHRTHEGILFPLLAIGSLAIFISLAVSPQSFSFGRMASLLLLYGVAIFVLLSNAMTRGLAAWLTRNRGEHWVKELDYLYLSLGSVGILATVNRLPFITGKIESGDLIAPVLLTTAIVIRFIKTRAEIGGWNRPPTTPVPAAPSDPTTSPLAVETGLFSDITETHEHEEKLRCESIALIEAEDALKGRLLTIQKAMTLIFAYTIEHTSQNEGEAVAQMLGIRVFNAAASSVKLGLSGYYQTAFQQARDILETGYLLDYFRTSPEQISVWKNADYRTRRKLFDPVKIREQLDKRDGDTSMKRTEQYRQLSELASHATYRGFRMTARQGFGELGPFVERVNLEAWLHEMVLRLGPSAVMYANQFPNADPKLASFLQEFGTDLVRNYKQGTKLEDEATDELEGNKGQSAT